MDKDIKLFENKRIRHEWDADNDEWLFAVVDVVAALTESPNPQTYWRVMKKRLKDEGNESVTNCNALKMKATDGKMRLTDVANSEGILRIIQSIPSPKAEPFKMWLAQVGSERIDETIDPEIALERAIETYLKKGYSREWVHQRMLTIKIRNELTGEWDNRGIKKGIEYAILTDEISKAWAGKTTKEYKQFKGLQKENLRDNMTTLELVLNMLAEATTTELAKAHDAQGLTENTAVARRGGKVAGDARKAIEADSGKPVISPENAEEFQGLLSDLIIDVADKDEDK